MARRGSNERTADRNPHRHDGRPRPYPFCGMLPAVGRRRRAGRSHVTEVDRPSRSTPSAPQPASIAVDMKHPGEGGTSSTRSPPTPMQFVDGPQPGAAERLGIEDPTTCSPRARLRMTGWGQDGPYARAQMAGHDIGASSASLAGALHGRPAGAGAAAQSPWRLRRWRGLTLSASSARTSNAARRVSDSRRRRDVPGAAMLGVFYGLFAESLGRPAEA